jgi:hypothetical protein
VPPNIAPIWDDHDYPSNPAGATWAESLD